MILMLTKIYSPKIYKNDFDSYEIYAQRCSIHLCVHALYFFRVQVSSIDRNCVSIDRSKAESVCLSMCNLGRSNNIFSQSKLTRKFGFHFQLTKLFT